MADQDKDLLASLTNTQLPAVPSPEPAEPAEPKEVSRESESGKAPDEVVSRETRLPADKEETAQPAKPEEKRYEVRGIKYTAKELEAAGLLEDLAVTHSKYQHLQEKHLQEKDKAAVTKPEERPAVPVITNPMIAKAYDQAATAILNNFVQENLMEADLGEAYPRAMQTMIGQMRYAFDLIFDMKSRLEPMLEEVSAAKEKVQGQAVQNAYTQQLDALTQKDAKLYAGLKDPKIRDAFTKYLVDELGATIGMTTGEKAPAFLAKQWVAFNSDVVIAAAKTGTQEKEKDAKRRLVVGEGTGSRTGVVDSGEQSHLERMIANSGKIPE